MNQQIYTHSFLQCPSCHNPLKNNQCHHCGITFNEILGILDLRWPQQENTDKENDLVSKLITEYPHSKFDELVNIRFLDLTIPLEYLDTYQSYQSSMQARGQKMMTMFRKRLSHFYSLPNKRVSVDLGCGVGASSIILAKEFSLVIGIDPSLPDLILAKKYFQEQQINNITLIQAYAQNLPLRNDVVSFITAQNVIEHLFDVESAFWEIQRILQHEGCFCGDSRNRFDLFFPEPHAKLRWVGLFPRKLQPWYVRKFKNIPYTSAHLLSWFELTRYAKRVFGKLSKVIFPLVSAYGQSQKLDRITQIIEKIPVLNLLILFIFPSHLLITQIIKENNS